jgi:alkyldihydroxyacetonephosphate synthase
VIEIDEASLLVSAPGEATLGAVEEELHAHGLTLGLFVDSSTSVRGWIDAGLPGAHPVFADPADHVLAGFVATLVNEDKVVVRPAPRRAVGPDLAALFLGAHGRFGRVDRAWLRVHHKVARRVALPLRDLEDHVDLDPPLGEDEERLLDAIAEALEG